MGGIVVTHSRLLISMTLHEPVSEVVCIVQSLEILYKKYLLSTKKIMK